MNKNYKLLVPFFAVALLLLVSFSSAFATIDKVEFNGVELDNVTTVVGSVGSTVPVLVQFTATDDATEVEIEIEINGYREDVSASKYIGRVENGTTLSKMLNLDLPSNLKNVLSEDAIVTITLSAKGKANVYNGYDISIRMQRESYEVSVLSVDYNTKVSGGDIVPVSVVLKNTGYDRLDDNYVIVSIPALGISTRGYVGDLTALDNVDDEEDSMEKTVFLQIPSNAETGVYELVVEAYNDDTETVQKSVIAIDGVTTPDDDKVLNQKEGNSNSIIALTIVLAVVFVALLVVLIVLITKKDKAFEEVETSYY